MKKNKPYFEGQKKSKCGHYYPDVLRNYDRLSEDGKYLERHIYCLKCKKEFVRRKSIDAYHLPELDLFEKEKTIKQLQAIKKRILKERKGELIC